MAQTYQVNYIVNVDATTAQTAINQFKRALSSLSKATGPLMELQRQVRSVTDTLAGINRRTYQIKVDTAPATKKLGKLISALKMAQREVRTLNDMGVTLGGVKNRTKTQKSTSTATPAASTVRTPKTTAMPSRPVAQPSAARASRLPASTKPIVTTSNIGYKLWGPTPLPNNGGMALDMLKGMGIAYGIAGMGSLISSVVDQAAEYDNLMKTVENILKSHDTKGNFHNRFSSMEQTIRNVGMETKFKVTEVADAAKFLSMAGLDLESIQRSIRPIADIALVGDTELGQTADLVTNIMTGYNIAPEKMRLAADIMTNTFTMSNTTLTEIAEAYKYAAPLLSAGNVAFEEATAAIGVLGDAGIKGSQAGTTMRTIMANVVNPTKKQRAAWDAIGISRYDANGNVKDLVKLFQELHDANLGVDVFYKLFHKTAASGAVSLADRVKKWDEVMIENRLSGGLSAHLADEKKNTLKGLWAQLVSVFVDNGVDAFNGVQNQLRDLMLKAINWMKYNPEFKEALHTISTSMMEFIHIMIDATKWFGKLFNVFGPLLKTWMKFQLYIWPIVKAITAFRSVFMGLTGIQTVANKVRGLSQSILGLSTAATQATAALTSASVRGGHRGIFNSRVDAAHEYFYGTRMASDPQFRQLLNTDKKAAYRYMHSQYTPYMLGLYDRGKQNAMLPPGYAYYEPGIAAPTPLRGFFGQQYIEGPNGKLMPVEGSNKPSLWKRTKQYWKTPKASLAGSWNRAVNAVTPSQQTWRRLNVGLRGGIGKLGNPASMIAGGALSYAAMDSLTEENKNGYDTAAGGLFGAAGVAAMFGPWGLVAAGVLAAVGGVMKYFAAVKRAKEAVEELKRVNAAWTVKDGVIINENAKGIIKWLQTIWQKHHSIREEVELRIAKTRELLGLENQEVADKKNISRKVFEQQFGLISQGGTWVGTGPLEESLSHIQSMSSVSGISADFDNKNHKATFTINGKPHEVRNYYDAAGNVAIIEEALTGEYRQQIMEDFSHRIAAVLSSNSGDKANQLLRLQEIFEEDYGEAYFGKFKLNLDKRLGKDKWKEYGSKGELTTDRLFNETVYNSLANRFGSGADLPGLYRAFEDAKTNSTAELFNKFAALYDLTDERGLSLKKLGTKEWLEEHGFRFGTFVGGRDSANTAMQMVEDFYTKLGYFGLTGQETPEMQNAIKNIEDFKNKILWYQWVDDQIKSGKALTDIPALATEQGTQLYEGFRYGDSVWENGQWVNSPLASLQEAAASQEVYNMGYNMGGAMYQGYCDAAAGVFQTATSNSNNTATAAPAYCPLLLPIQNQANNVWLPQFSTYGYNFGSSAGYNFATNWANAFNNNISNISFGGINGGSDLDSWAGFPYPINVTKRMVQNGQTTAPAGATATVAAPPKATVSGGCNGGGGGGRNGTSSSDYKSHAKERAVPKQININIQNLMKVDSVDLVGPEKEEVLGRLKREVAMALYEAAADGTMMLNNLATT